MRRLLLVVCWLAAAQTVCARKPAVRFDQEGDVEEENVDAMLTTGQGAADTAAVKR